MTRTDAAVRILTAAIEQAERNARVPEPYSGYRAELRQHVAELRAALAVLARETRP